MLQENDENRCQMIKSSFREWEVEWRQEMKTEGKWAVKFRKGTVEEKADSGGDPAGALGMTECQGNPASTPKVSPTSRPTAKCMAARGRQGYGHAGFGAGTGAGWQRMARLCSPRVQE